MVFARNRKPNSDVEDEEIEWQVDFRENFTLSRTEGTGMQLFGKILIGIIFAVLGIYLVAVIINKAAGGDTIVTISTPPPSAPPAPYYGTPQVSRYGGSQAFSM